MSVKQGWMAKWCLPLRGQWYRKKAMGHLLKDLEGLPATLFIWNLSDQGQLYNPRLALRGQEVPILSHTVVNHSLPPSLRVPQVSAGKHLPSYFSAVLPEGTAPRQVHWICWDRITTEVRSKRVYTSFILMMAGPALESFLPPEYLQPISNSASGENAGQSSLYSNKDNNGSLPTGAQAVA